ncbi:MAG: DUF3137 domain-containing protein [Candidatus Thermoplasmatota archaeon]|jgi:hypothetical protein|nr:DUF3137 domain-containing protein [Candidatus Thermoplasmatota archaeon]
MEVPETLYPILFGLFVIIVITLVLVLSLWRYRVIRQLMEQQAMKHGGSVVGSYLLPVLKFPYRGLPVVVTSVPGTKYRPAKTEVNITLKKVAAADLKIMTESLGTRLGKAFGASDVLLNSDEFDREFVIKTQDEAFVRTILTLTLQEKLLRMRQQKPRISLESTWLAVSVPRVIRTEERYDELFELAFYITDQVLEPGF